VPIFKVTGREVRVGRSASASAWSGSPRTRIRLKNLWRSSPNGWPGAEAAMAAARADEKRGRRFRNAGKSGDTVLTYSGPDRAEAHRPPAARTRCCRKPQLNDQDIKDVTGLHDASLGMQSNETSGKAIHGPRAQGDVATYIYHDNLHAAIREAGGSSTS
jgi:hypothetical protein